MAGEAAEPGGDELDHDLKSLVFGDHLDLEDAVEHLTGPLRYAFAGHLRIQSEPIDELEESLWLRPETMLVGDYWRYGKQSRIIDVLCSKGRSRRTTSFARLRDFFAADGDGDSAGGIVTVMDELLSGEKPTYYRCLMLHPDQAVRRYAVNNIDPEGLWKAVTPQAVPLATILSALERVTGSERYDDNFRRVFFNSVHKRLFNLTSRSELIYARGIVRVFSEMSFFMEDEYFEKLVRVVDYLRAKEKFFGFENSVLDDYVARLRREKEKTGSLSSESPNLTAIPAVVLRKLARDGHYWYELAMHPMFKIARETVRHINTPDRAVRIAGNHVASPDVLREIGRKRSLFGTLPARVTLLSNPRTPPTISMGYIMDLGRTEVEALLRKSTVHPELRLQLRRRLNAHA